MHLKINIQFSYLAPGFSELLHVNIKLIVINQLLINLKSSLKMEITLKPCLFCYVFRLHFLELLLLATMRHIRNKSWIIRINFEKMTSQPGHGKSERNTAPLFGNYFRSILPLHRNRSFLYIFLCRSFLTFTHLLLFLLGFSFHNKDITLLDIYNIRACFI